MKLDNISDNGGSIVLMRHTWFLLVFVSALFLSAGCSFAPVQRHREPVAPSLGKDDVVVYVFREPAYIGGGTSSFIYDGDKKVGACTNSGYFWYKRKAGTVKLRASLDTAEALVFPVKANTTYYVRCAVGGTNGFQLTKADRALSKPVIEKLVYTTLEDSTKPSGDKLETF